MAPIKSNEEVLKSRANAIIARDIEYFKSGIEELFEKYDIPKDAEIAIANTKGDKIKITAQELFDSLHKSTIENYGLEILLHGLMK